MQHKVAILSVAVLLALAASAEAANLRMRPGSSGGSPPANAPILNNVTVPYGQYTANGMGGVRLSSQDDLTIYGVPVYGLGLMDSSGTACANWTTTQMSGTATHFSKYTGAEGATARTPVIASAGDSNNLQQGPYTFAINCTDAHGNLSNTAILTYTIVANAATMDEYTGNFPAVTSGYASFASTPGYKLLLPVGFKKLTGIGWSIVCPEECTLTWADLARPGLIQNFQPHPGQLTKLEVKDITFTGNGTANALKFLNPANPSTTLRLTNVGCKFKVVDIVSTLPGCLDTYWPGAPGDNMTDFRAENVGLGFRISAPGWNLRRVVVRNFFINGMDQLTADNLTMRDVFFIGAQVGSGGYHNDCWQVGNGATHKNWDIQRYGCFTAGGHSGVQGPIFPGHMTIGKGYVDDGAGGPGLNVQLTSPPIIHDPNSFFDEGADGSQFFTADGCISGVDNARVASSNGHDQAVLTGIAPRVCGSAASPIDVAAYSGENVNFKNIVHTGYSPWGMAVHSDHGTGGMQNFAYVGQVPKILYETNVTVNIVGNQMTTTGPTSSNVHYNAGLEYGQPGTGYGFTYPGLTGGTLFLTAKSAGSRYCIGDNGGCVYTLNRAPGDVSGVTISAVPPVGVIPLSQMVPIKQMNANVAWLHTGTQTYKDGFTSSGVQFPNFGGSSYSPGPPVNTTLTNVYSTGTATPATSFLYGDPTTNLQAVPQATWDNATDQETIALYCHFLMPNPGGPLDNGDGTFASPFKLVGGQGQWSDGTPIPGCN